MILRLQRYPFRDRSDRLLRLQGFSVITLGVLVLRVWNPLTQPGPKLCLLRHAVGLPCPLCGMTRGVSLCLRGRWHEASLFNPLAGPVLVLGAALAIKWAIEYAGGRRIDVLLHRWLERGWPLAALLLVLLNWVYMLTYRREDPFAASWLGQLWSALSGGS